MGVCVLQHLYQGPCWPSTVSMEASKLYTPTLTTLTTMVPSAPVSPSCSSLSGDFSFEEEEKLHRIIFLFSQGVLMINGAAHLVCPVSDMNWRIMNWRKLLAAELRSGTWETFDAGPCRRWFVDHGQSAKRSSLNNRTKMLTHIRTQYRPRVLWGAGTVRLGGGYPLSWFNYKTKNHNYPPMTISMKTF